MDLDDRAGAGSQVLPGVATVLVRGLLLLTSGNRATAMLGGWLSGSRRRVVCRWPCVWPDRVAIGDVGAPVAATDAKRVVAAS